MPTSHAPAVRTANALVRRRRDDAVLMTLPADHTGRPRFRLPAVALGDHESPAHGAKRALQEETGLQAAATQHLVEQQIPPTEPGQPAALTIVIDCGSMTDDVHTPLPPCADGRFAYAWVTRHMLERLCEPHQARLVEAALDAPAHGGLAEL
ncbi:NUDIX domain-containing protein [Streptomyces sp. NPDC015125]|uniref:NUDIX domain-containing protein n=1 Tax=Streptomyces sp. NPDC015125 TaxID=3364938 RepID=UPI003701850F